MVQVSDHLGVVELQARWRESRDATLTRHYQVVWLLAEGRSCAEVARLAGFVRRWVELLRQRPQHRNFNHNQKLGTGQLKGPLV